MASRSRRPPCRRPAGRGVHPGPPRATRPPGSPPNARRGAASTSGSASRTHSIGRTRRSPATRRCRGRSTGASSSGSDRAMPPRTRWLRVRGRPGILPPMSTEPRTETEAEHAERMRTLQAEMRSKIRAASEKRDLLIVHTGDGKGKSTAAFGMLARSLGHGRRCAVIQFIKAGDAATSGCSGVRSSPGTGPATDSPGTPRIAPPTSPGAARAGTSP